MQVEVQFAGMSSNTIAIVVYSGQHYLVPMRQLRKIRGYERYTIDHAYLNENNIVRGE